MALKWKMLLYFMIVWDILWPFGMMYSSFCCSLWSFGTFFPFWYVWTKKNLATNCTSEAVKARPFQKWGKNIFW
jgi:hypothetical protein